MCIFIRPKNIFKIARTLTSKMMDIQTFIFVDSETTGLPSQEYNKTKITELCFTAVQSEHIKLGVFPRVQNKLILCFNPLKMISPVATDLTGLANDLLEYEPQFQADSFNLINDFLNLRRRPICFVAHNGDYFDYPILRAEINKTGCTLPDDILCIDSLQTFRDLQSVFEQTNETLTQTNLDIHEVPTQKSIPLEFCDGYDELLFNLAEKIENSTSIKRNVQLVNESTPKKKCTIDVTDSLKSVDIDSVYYIPETSQTRIGRQSNNMSITGTSNPSPRKSLNFRMSFKLGDVYTRLTKKRPVESHRAEHDVSMLIECAATLGHHFTNWANANAKKFSDIPMMKPGRKLGS